MAETEEDPFAVFGSDEDEDDGDEDAKEAHSGVQKASPGWASEQLIKSTNQRMEEKALSTNGLHAGRKEPIGVGETATPSSDVSFDASSLLQIHVFEPPLYLNPSIALVSNLPVGGGRGYIATRPLSPGTLLLVEAPMLDWPDEQLGKALGLVSVEHILRHPQAQAMLRELEHFYPTKDHIDSEGEASDSSTRVQVGDMFKKMRQDHGQDAVRLVLAIQPSQGQKLLNSDKSLLGSQDALRLLLALRYNGLQSGIYRHVAMLNHGDPYFNAVSLPSDKNGWTEVRTTRNVPAGESLTISYLPRIYSHARRRKILWEQHRFDIGDTPTKNGDMELVGGKIPVSSLINEPQDGTIICSHIEAATEQLEDQYQEVLSSVSMVTSVTDETILEQVKQLEVSTGELVEEAARQLQNDRHLLLIPCLRLHLDLCDLVQRIVKLAVGQRILLLKRLIKSGRRLADLQEEYYGPDHFELARTHLEVAQALQELLSRISGRGSRSVTSWDDLGDGIRSFADCSRLEHQLRKEHERIQALYPDDSDAYVVGSNSVSKMNE